MLERASVTTAQAHTCISPLGRRISMEWCKWWMQQQCGQQQHGHLFGVLLMVHVLAAVLVRAIREGSEAAERSLCGLVRVGQQCSRRVILVSCSGSCARLPKAFSTLGGLIRTYVTRHTRTCALAVAVCPLRLARCRDRSRSSIVCDNAPRNGDLHMCTV